jgi:hypothetical protein
MTYREEIVNCETGKSVFRDFTPAETKQMQDREIELEALREKDLEWQAKRLEIISKLGITADEAKLLLG